MSGEPELKDIDFHSTHTQTRNSKQINIFFDGIHAQYLNGGFFVPAGGAGGAYCYYVRPLPLLTGSNRLLYVQAAWLCV